ncbi:hypothetical protein [Pantoea phytobeneficialis]|uniref:Toxin n=2 Tax=Pantoea phytobeneficialis TaxID=2052056 RepID=A0ABT8XWZ5_9GAMM|nr:hypothetical protein [Pantoea phytobeneficialis]MDO6407419.1 hypothetical protein [Pantoea phytobeneficialis]
MPTMAEYISESLLIKNRLKILYERYARIEYTASVFNDYLVDDWLGVDAQTAWLANMQAFLTPEMRYQNLTPFLADATKIVIAEWKKVLSTADAAHEVKIMHDDEMHAEFIAIVQKAFVQSCRIHKNQLFCQYYTMDNGSFSFIKHDFIAERKPRLLSRRLVERDHPDVLMPVVEYKGMREEFTASRKLMESWQAVTDTMMYQQEVNNVALKFIGFSPLPFHERLYGYALGGPDWSSVQADDVITMINSIINENGRLVDYQLRVLQRYLPADMVMDTDRVLALLSDLFRLKHPTIPRLYTQVIFYLQTPLAGADVTLRQLSDGSFAHEQVKTVMRRFAMLLESEQGATINAVRRYIRAAIHHQLDFTRHLAAVDPALIDSVAGEGIGRQLCLGAIIAQQLGWENVVHGDLVRLYSLAIRDAGIVPMNALSRLALFNMPGNNLAEDALATFGHCIEHGAKTLKPLVACINDNQHLMASLEELTFVNATPRELRLLGELVVKAIQNQHALLTLAMPAQKEQPFRTAYARGELQLTWYLAREANSTGEFTAAGVGFDIVNQQGGLIFPLGLPVPESGMFLQTPAHISNRTLTAACFDDGQIGKMQFKRKTVTPAPSQDKENSGVVTLLTRYLETRSQNFQQQLARANNATEFNTIKERFQQWLTQFFAFYRDSSSLYEQLDAERIIQLTAESDVNSWITGQRPKPDMVSSGDYFEQAIRGLMSGYTDYPGYAARLRTRSPVNNTLSPASLPENGFAGVWWDPMSYCCYLGFINGDDDQLFASLVGQRATLFPLADKHAHATIWQSLSLATELQLNLTAMRNGEITATEFFDQYVSDAWRKQHDQAEERWQLMTTVQASALIEQGVMTPLSYLQKTAAVNSTATKLTPYILQYHNGNFVFILSKDDYQNIDYRVLDPSGQLQVMPVGTSEWSQTVTAAPGRTARQQFRATVDRFLTEEEKKTTPTFLPLLNIQQQRNISAALLLRQKTSTEQFRQLANATAGIPYSYTVEDDYLMEIEQHLHAYGTNLVLQLQERMEHPVDISPAIWDVFMWRKANLYDPHIFNNTLQDLKSRAVVLSTLDRFIKRGVKMEQFPGKDSISWVADKLNILNHTIAAFEWFRSERKPPSRSRDGMERLYQNCLAENNFFSRYGTSPHCTPDAFQQPWAFEIDQHPSTLNVTAWQAGFDLLRQLTAGLTGSKLLNTFLELNAEKWQEAHMRNHTRIFEQQFNRTVDYWQQPHDANEIMIIRPTLSPFGFDLAAAKRKKPTQLILTARIGSASHKEKASPFLAGPEVAEDLLLENVRQAGNTVTAARLAGISSHPHTAKEFVAWTKHRLAGPIFMSELSSPAFLWRLQHRIRQVIATEAELWREDERRFYRSSPTHHFLNIADFTADNKSQRLEFFQALYASELLIVRLIMPDAEMVFGMLCALAPKQDDDVTYAWVCLKDTHENIPSEQHLPTIHVVGV